MKGIYLAAFIAEHPTHNIVYQDINGKRDIGGDMMTVDLSTYDYVIATPPCNWYSRANWRRNSSEYSLITKHLLPEIIEKLEKLGKPYIVENVCNKTLVPKGNHFKYIVGNHTYWTNIPLQIDRSLMVKQDKQHISQKEREGGNNVWQVIETFIQTVEQGNFLLKL